MTKIYKWNSTIKPNPAHYPDGNVPESITLEALFNEDGKLICAYDKNNIEQCPQHLYEKFSSIIRKDTWLMR